MPISRLIYADPSTHSVITRLGYDYPMVAPWITFVGAIGDLTAAESIYGSPPQYRPTFSHFLSFRTASVDFNWVRDGFLIAFRDQVTGDVPPVLGEILLALDEDGTSRLVQVHGEDERTLELVFLPSPTPVTTMTTTTTFACPSQKYDFKASPSTGAKDSSLHIREVVAVS